MWVRLEEGHGGPGKTEVEVEVQMIACGSFARDVPSRNLRSFSFVSWEKEYNLESDWKSLANDQASG